MKSISKWWESVRARRRMHARKSQMLRNVNLMILDLEQCECTKSYDECINDILAGKAIDRTIMFGDAHYAVYSGRFWVCRGLEVSSASYGLIYAIRDRIIEM